MGRTVLPFSRVLEQKFRSGKVSQREKKINSFWGFEEAESWGYASRPWPFETILISILLEHEKALVELRGKIKSLEEKKI
jgi:hypothetical protein